MKSVKLQLLVTLVAVTAAVGMFAIRGLPPRLSFRRAVRNRNVEEVCRNARWGADVHAKDIDDRTPLHRMALSISSVVANCYAGMMVLSSVNI